MKQNKLIVTIVLVVLLNVLAIYAGFFLFSSVVRGSDKVIEVREEIKFNEKRIANSRSLENLVTELSEEKEKFDSIFLNEQNIIQLIEKIELMSRQAGTSLKISSIDIAGKTEEKPSLKLVVKGGFGQVFHFLVLLENISYTVSIDKLSFQKLDDERWQGSFNIQLNNFLKT